jgi:hypothetical protein
MSLAIAKNPYEASNSSCQETNSTSLPNSIFCQPNASSDKGSGDSSAYGLRMTCRQTNSEKVSGSKPGDYGIPEKIIVQKHSFSILKFRYYIKTLDFEFTEAFGGV